MHSIKSKSQTVCLHIFRRDYRLYDNTSLIQACKTFDLVIPIFIFNHKQIDSNKNPYRSDNAVQFLCESLADLDSQLRHLGSQLFIFYGDEFAFLELLLKYLKSYGLAGVSFNADYTKYSQERDSRIKGLCHTNNL